jgi:hypothetical protein
MTGDNTANGEEAGLVEEKKLDEDPMHTGNDNLLQLESEDVEPNTDGIWKKLWDSMNPSVCLGPATACTNVLTDDETIDYNSVVPPMLRDMQHTGKQRTAALEKLYRFTDRERYQNR